MRIIGCDLHASQQTIAMLDCESGEVIERTLRHEGDTVRAFYGSLARPVVYVQLTNEITELDQRVRSSCCAPSRTPTLDVPCLSRVRVARIRAARAAARARRGEPAPRDRDEPYQYLSWHPDARCSRGWPRCCRMGQSAIYVSPL